MRRVEAERSVWRMVHNAESPPLHGEAGFLAISQLQFSESFLYKSRELKRMEKPMQLHGPYISGAGDGI